MNYRSVRFAIGMFLLILLCSCATGKNPQDPYENYNRKVFAFNTAFDTVIFKPLARTYTKITPTPIRAMIGNFFNNLNDITVIANDLLQFDFHFFLRDSTRFLINTTYGVVGLIDVAGKSGLEKRENDLGITLAKWGDKNSPYFVIPVLGPSTIRDAWGFSFDYFLFSVYPHISSEKLRYSLLILNYVHLRAQLLEATDLMEKAALDQYTFQRDAFLQHRNYIIRGKKEKEGDDSYVESEEDDDDPYVAGDDDKSTSDDKKDDNKKETPKNTDNKKPDAQVQAKPIKAPPTKNTPDKNTHSGKNTHSSKNRINLCCILFCTNLRSHRIQGISFDYVQMPARNYT